MIRTGWCCWSSGGSTVGWVCSASAPLQASAWCGTSCETVRGEKWSVKSSSPYPDAEDDTYRHLGRCVVGCLFGEVEQMSLKGRRGRPDFECEAKRISDTGSAVRGDGITLEPIRHFVDVTASKKSTRRKNSITTTQRNNSIPSNFTRDTTFKHS